MNIKEMSDEIAEETGLTKGKSRLFVDSITGIIADELSERRKVTLSGFGTFEAKSRIGRLGVNPITGKEMQIPDSVCAKFKPSKTFRDSIREAE